MKQPQYCSANISLYKAAQTENTEARADESYCCRQRKLDTKLTVYVYVYLVQIITDLLKYAESEHSVRL